MHFPEEPFLSRDLAELGISRRDLTAGVVAGRVRCLLRGVYVGAAAAESTLLRCQAAALVLPPGVVVCDRSAAWIHAVDTFEREEQDERAHRLEVVSTIGDRVRRPETLGGRRSFAPGDVQTLHGVAVTTPVRTACDLGRLRGRSGAFAAMCMLARAHGLTGEALTCAAARLGGARGVVQLRELAPRVTGACESHGEAWALLALLDEGLPVPEAQFEVYVPGWGLARLDFAYPGARVAVEYDGEQHHSRPVDVQRDEARRAALRAMGWSVIVVRKEQLGGKQLLAWLAEVRRALEGASESSRRRYARSTREQRGRVR